MRFTINVKEDTKLKSFLSFNRVDYVDVYVNKSVVYFVLDNIELYTHTYYEILTREGIAEDFNFRLNRDKFGKLLTSGFIEFIFVNDNINIKFKNEKNEFLYSFSAKYQACYSVSYMEKFSILGQLELYKKSNIEQLIPLVKVAKNLNALVSVCENLASVNSDGVMIFQETECPDFCLPALTLNFMLNNSYYVYSVQRYLISESDTMCIVATKYRSQALSDYDFLKNQKSTHKIVFGITNIVNLAKRCSLLDGEFILDFESKVCKYNEEKCAYETNINVVEIRSGRENRNIKNIEKQLENFSLDAPLPLNITMDSGSVHKTPKLIINSRILSKVLNIAENNSHLTLKIKRNFLEVSINSMIIAFSRRDYIAG